MTTTPSQNKLPRPNAPHWFSIDRHATATQASAIWKRIPFLVAGHVTGRSSRMASREGGIDAKDRASGRAGGGGASETTEPANDVVHPTTANEIEFINRAGRIERSTDLHSASTTSVWRESLRVQHLLPYPAIQKLIPARTQPTNRP